MRIKHRIPRSVLGFDFSRLFTEVFRWKIEKATERGESFLKYNIKHRIITLLKKWVKKGGILRFNRGRDVLYAPTPQRNWGRRPPSHESML